MFKKLLVITFALILPLVTWGQRTTLPPAGGGISSVAGLVDPTQQPYGAKFDARFFNDGSISNGVNTLTSATLNCSTADNGKLVIVVNGSGYPFGTGLVTQTGCTSSTVATLSTTSNATASGLNWAIGTDNTTALTSAATAAWTTGATIFMPCAATIISGRPFVAASAQTLTQEFYLSGCGGGGSSITTFILHPQVTSAVLTGGTIFYQAAGVTGISPAGGNNTIQVSGLQITTLGGALPFTSGTGTFIQAIGGKNLQFQLYGLTGGSCTTISSSGEAYYDRINLQNTTANGCTGVSMTGQGANVVSNSVLAFNPSTAISCNAAICSLLNDYVINSGGNGNAAIGASGAANVNIIGGTYTQIAVNPIIAVSSTATLSLSNTVVSNGNASGVSISAASGSKIYANASTITATNAASTITGIGGTGAYFDLGGNTLSSGITAITPTCAATTGGTACSVLAGSTNEKGTVRITASAVATGTVTITFAGTFAGATGTTPAGCGFNYANAGGTGSWSLTTTTPIVLTTRSTTAPVINWNQTAALSAGSTYDIDYCFVAR